MNLLNMKNVNPFINKATIFLVIVTLALISHAWEVDFSRRSKDLNTKSSEIVPWPSTQKNGDEFLMESPLKQMFSSVDVAQIISILHTEDGFVPNTLRLKKDISYKIYVVNVNEKFKNSSFILDSFGQSFGIYFGKTKNFDLNPRVEGSFVFVSPESGAQGKVIVFSEKESLAPLAVTQNEVKK